MDIRLVACDLDGTLLDDEGKVSRENLLAIDELSSRGIYFVPTSGRVFSEMPTELTQNPSIRYYLTSGGATIYDKLTDTVDSVSLPQDKLDHLLGLARSMDPFVIVHSGKRALVDRRRLGDARISAGYLPELFDKVAEDLSDPYDYLYGGGNVDMLSLVFRDPEENERFYNAAKEVEGLALSKNTIGHASFNVEINHKDGNKGEGVGRLAKRLGIDERLVAAVGDSGNDISMISRYKLSFAVDNAYPEIKRAAGYRLTSNREHAIKYLFENYILK